LSTLDKILEMLAEIPPVPDLDLSALDPFQPDTSYSDLIKTLESFCEANSLCLDHVLWWINSYYRGPASEGLSGLVADLNMGELLLSEVLQNFSAHQQESMYQSQINWILQTELLSRSPESVLSLVYEILEQYGPYLPESLLNISPNLLAHHLHDLLLLVFQFQPSPDIHIIQ
jgi:hypothetical protein